MMKINMRAVSVAAIIPTMMFASHAWGECNTDRKVTLAASEYEISGNGNLTCADLNMSLDLTNDEGTTIDIVDNVVSVTTDQEFDVVIVEPSNGDRCLYNYPTIAMVANGLTPSRIDSSVSEVIVCSDEQTGIVVAEPEEPEPPVTLPYTTASNSCTGEIIIDGENILGDQEAVVVAETIDGQTVAACSITDSGQEFCEDRCINFSDRGETGACLNSVNNYTYTGGNTGEYGLDACKPCLTALDVLAGEGYEEPGYIPGVTKPALHPDQTGATPSSPIYMEYCWEKVNSVYEGELDLSGTPPALDVLGTPEDDTDDEPRTADTMLKHTPVRQSETSITWYNACYKTKISVNGRDYWTTTCK